MALYDEYLITVEVKRIDERLGVEHLPLAEGRGVQYDLFTNVPGVGLIKPAAGLLLTLAQLIHARKSDVIQNIGIDVKRRAVEGVEGPASGYDDVIVAVHAHFACDHVAAAEFFSERLVAGLFDLAHGVPHLDDGKLLFVVQHRYGRPVGIEHAHRGRCEVIHAAKRRAGVFKHACKALIHTLCYDDDIRLGSELFKAAA